MQIQFGNLVNQTNDLVPTSPQEFQNFKSTVLDCCYGQIATQGNNNNLLAKNRMDQLILLKRNKDLILSKSDKGTGADK